MLHSIRAAVAAGIAAGILVASAVAAQAGQPDRIAVGAPHGFTLAPNPSGEELLRGHEDQGQRRCGLSRCTTEELPQGKDNVAEQRDAAVLDRTQGIQVPGSVAGPKACHGDEIPS
jgi:hypothetical protein